MRSAICRGDGTWEYRLGVAGAEPGEELHVHFGGWSGVFECLEKRHVEVLTWPEANALVVVTSNAVYLVNPEIPGKFSGVLAPIGITDVTFDKAAGHMFVAGSVRVYAFTSDLRFRWISEALEGYGAHFRGCGGRVVAVDVKQSEPGPDGVEAPTAVVRLRAEDGTVLRSRFRRICRYRLENMAA